GEKLSEYHVSGAMKDVLANLDLSLTSYSLAPCWHDEQPYYGLFVERRDLSGREQGLRVAEALDRRLQELNIEYASTRHSLLLARRRFAHGCEVPTASRNRSFAGARSHTEFGNEGSEGTRLELVA